MEVTKKMLEAEHPALIKRYHDIDGDWEGDWCSQKGCMVLSQDDLSIHIHEIHLGNMHPGNRAIAGALGRMLVYFEEHGALPGEVAK